MGLYVKQSEARTQLQQRLDAELRAKVEAKSKQPNTDAPDGVDDSAYIKNMKQTSSLAWVWLVLFVVVVVGFGVFVYYANTV